MMTRRIMALVCALLLLLLPAVLAESGQSTGHRHVVDDAGLLSAEKVAALEDKAQRLSEQYGLEIAILTTRGTQGKAIQYFAADFWGQNGYGTGADHDGVMLTLDMVERDWFILTTGAGIRYYTDYGIQALGKEFVSKLSDGDYYGGFDRYLDLAGAFAKEAQENQPYDTNHEYKGEPKTLAQKLLGALPVGIAASALSTLLGMGGMKRGMHTAKKKRGASQYARRDSMRLNRSMDVFLYHTQSRMRLPDPPRGGGGGGSSTFHSSSGTTHGGGGGKF